jgi:hypothetical protein
MDKKDQRLEDDDEAVRNRDKMARMYYGCRATWALEVKDAPSSGPPESGNKFTNAATPTPFHIHAA